MPQPANDSEEEGQAPQRRSRSLSRTSAPAELQHRPRWATRSGAGASASAAATSKKSSPVRAASQSRLLIGAASSGGGGTSFVARQQRLQQQRRATCGAVAPDVGVLLASADGAGASWALRRRALAPWGLLAASSLQVGLTLRPLVLGEGGQQNAGDDAAWVTCRRVGGGGGTIQPPPIAAAGTDDSGDATAAEVVEEGADVAALLQPGRWYALQLVLPPAVAVAGGGRAACLCVDAAGANRGGGSSGSGCDGVGCSCWAPVATAPAAAAEEPPRCGACCWGAQAAPGSCVAGLCFEQQPQQQPQPQPGPGGGGSKASAAGGGGLTMSALFSSTWAARWQAPACVPRARAPDDKGGAAGQAAALRLQLTLELPWGGLCALELPVQVEWRPCPTLLPAAGAAARRWQRLRTWRRRQSQHPGAAGQTDAGATLQLWRLVYTASCSCSGAALSDDAEECAAAAVGATVTCVEAICTPGAAAAAT